MATTARPGRFGNYGYQQITTLTSSTALTIPGGGKALVGGSDTPSDVNAALIQATTQDVRWRDDGTAPTATVGMLLKADSDMWYEGDLNRLRFIEVAVGGVLNVSYYTTPFD